MPELGYSFTFLDSVDSTNNYAMAQAHAGLAKHGMAYLAREQTAGRGQRGKEWTAQPGENITMSLVLEPDFLKYPQQFYLSAAVALGCYDYYNIEAGGETSIKWPNDIYWRDRKAGGILIENVLKGEDWKYSIVGIGMNINQTDFGSLKKAVSLRAITGISRDVRVAAKQVCACIDMRLNQLKKQQATIINDYNSLLFRRNETVRLRKNNITFQTTIKGCSPEGRLLTHHSLPESFAVGEVEWIG